MRIHHVGFLTKNLDRTQMRFEALGYKVEREKAYDSIRDINIAFLVNGDYRVELVEPASKESPMYPLLARYKNTPYHFCYVTEDLDQTLQQLTENGYTAIDTPAPAPCIDGRRVVFLMNRDAGMIELVEQSQGGSSF